ncbi:hypothetical protein [Smaragdicoccus niigatensis]|uniref:hypothetical protein n=1 Tax=Smaragdicoccus niigatensis TaxID=359359 RepID=UPI000369F7F1|nr:hypothetical protein [Smaragdicoccus niigatensis]
MGVNRLPVNAAAAAFGGSPGALIVAASTNFEHWERAVALAAQGHYARARAEIGRIRAIDDSTRSLVCSAQASWLRQLGWHRLAAGRDGAAVRHALAAPPSDLQVEALCDALTGLAADAIGQWRLAVTESLLHRVRDALDGRSEDRFWRALVRLSWVTAELSLASGNGRAALAHAESALERSREAGAVRHEIKSRLLVAASTSAVGEISRGAELAAEVAGQCAEAGLVPLEWAASMLLGGITSSPDAVARAHACAAEIERRGGVFR